MLCFLESQYKNIPLANILTVIVSYHSEDEIGKAKLILHELCCKYIDEDEAPCLITKKGKNNRKTNSEDGGNFLKLLDENKIELTLCVAIIACEVPHTEPAKVYLCLLLESVKELYKSVSSLLDAKSLIACKLPPRHCLISL